MGLKHVVRCGVWLEDPRDFSAHSTRSSKNTGEHPPARACVVSHMVVDCKSGDRLRSLQGSQQLIASRSCSDLLPFCWKLPSYAHSAYPMIASPWQYYWSQPSIRSSADLLLVSVFRLWPWIGLILASIAVAVVECLLYRAAAGIRSRWLW